ncbi:MAG: hypothetical protein JNM71_12800 [Flavobacterium lindanitolerans]|uniref:hypothetical protein n=1 Tax=Flavobacterium lindanitolerans TaxID=428988 RepID=UPI001A5F62C3|nr:hypothetical protein [Flavobacterium lindanitolerans]MBL7868886.1 hypothetical protein [Flavobacterium lindanitolerans]
MVEAFRQAVKGMIKEQLPMMVVSGTVKEVRENEIDVSRDEMPDLLDVRFQSIIDEELDSRFKIIPKVGSEVLCAIIENDVSEAYLLACSEVEKIEVKINDLIFELEGDGVRITNQGENLKSVLNEFQDEFGKLCTEVSKIVVAIGVTPDVPAITEIKNNVTVGNKNKLNKILIE